LTLFKKVTLKKSYAVSGGDVDGDTGNHSNERLRNLSVPNFVFWNAKYYYKKYIKLIFLLLLRKKNQLKIAQN
jgi:hypothetical protein